jgi:WD40 repeat protein
MTDDRAQQAVTQLTEELIRTQAPDLVRALAEVVTRLSDETVRQGVLAGLAQLTQSAGIDAICLLWANTRHSDLGSLLETTGWVASTPERLTWLTALKAGRLEIFEQAGAETVEPLLRACTDLDPVIAHNARLAFPRLQHPAAQAEFYRRVSETEQPLVREIALTVPYAPRDPQQRALFYLLTEQWEQYNSLDFDQSLLRAAYQVSNEWLRRRIAELTRRAGRAEFVEVLAGGRQRRRLAEMTDAEWTIILDLLIKEQAWAELWRLAQNAPAVWSVELLRRFLPLREQSAAFAGPDERAGLLELAGLAAQCSPEGLTLGSSARSQLTLTGHTGAIHTLAVSPDGQLLVSGSEDHTLRLWSLPDGKALKTLSDHSGEVWGVAISADGRLLASGSEDNSLRLWRLPDGQPLQTWQAYTGSVNTLVISPDNQWLASASHDHTIRLWSLPHGQLLKTLSGHTDLVIRLVLSPDGQLLASGSRDQSIRLWRLPDGTLRQTLTGHTSAVSGLAFSPDGLLLASGSLDKTIRLWRLPDGQLIKTLAGHTGGIVNLAVSSQALPGGTGGWLLASASSDQTVRLWRAPEGKLIQTLAGHTDWITGLAISPDGRWLVSGGYDQTLRLWASDLARLTRLPPTQITLADLAWLETTLGQKGIPDIEGSWLEFLLALLRWRRRFDIEIEDASPHLLIGEFDIELVG